HLAGGDESRALRDLDRALALDPQLGAALLARGTLHLQQGRHEQALADLAQARALGSNPATVAYNEALLHQARHDPASARACLQRALEHDPNHEPARSLLQRLK